MCRKFHKLTNEVRGKIHWNFKKLIKLVGKSQLSTTKQNWLSWNKCRWWPTWANMKDLISVCILNHITFKEKWTKWTKNARRRWLKIVSQLNLLTLMFKVKLPSWRICQCRNKNDGGTRILSFKVKISTESQFNWLSLTSTPNHQHTHLYQVSKIRNTIQAQKRSV
jgi:hypothetical protein